MDSSDPLAAKAREKLINLGKLALLQSELEMSVAESGQRRWCYWSASVGKILALLPESL